MRRRLVLLVCVAWLGVQPASAEESALTDDEIILKEEAGHRLMLPKDWPIDRKDGVIQPASLPEYLSMKFGQVREQFSRTEQRLGALEARLALLESERAALQRRIRALESAWAAAAEQVAEPPVESPPAEAAPQP